MLSTDTCLVHPSKRYGVGVCHLCLRDRLVRLSLSGESSSSLPPSSSRSSFDSSRQEENARNGVGKLGTIFSLIESDSEDVADGEQTSSSVPSFLPRSKSLSQWNHQPPRRSDARFMQMPMQCEDGDDGFANSACGHVNSVNGHVDSANGQVNGFANHHSPLASASATPVVHHIERDQSTRHSKNGLSWISSLFGLRKRKKKSTQNGAVETNFFPPEAWNDDYNHRSQVDRDRLWRSRSVSSGRVIKKSFTPLVDEQVGIEPPTKVPDEPSLPPRTSTSGTEPRVASLIAVDMRGYDMEKEKPATVASLMDIDRKYAHITSPAVLPRSKSTGGWRRKIRGESPSSFLTSNPTASNEWSFYLTPLRTFGRNRSTRHAR